MNLGQSKNELRCAPRDDSIVVDLMKIAPLTAHDEAQAPVERSLGAQFELLSRGAADRVLNDQRTHSRACRARTASRARRRGRGGSRARSPQSPDRFGRYLKEKVHAVEPAREVDAFLSPWYGWLVERLLAAIRPDGETGEAAEAPCCETGRGPGSTADVDFETRRAPYPVMKSHVNAMVSEISKVGEAVRRAAKSPGAGTVANDILR